uniref:Uncharacterized protein n=1 Tax=Rhizophora mucronata TaxID=61149 RepID=A0A2P2NY97_RHIMU
MMLCLVSHSSSRQHLCLI